MISWIRRFIFLGQISQITQNDPKHQNRWAHGQRLHIHMELGPGPYNHTNSCGIWAQGNTSGPGAIFLHHHLHHHQHSGMVCKVCQNAWEPTGVDSCQKVLKHRLAPRKAVSDWVVKHFQVRSRYMMMMMMIRGRISVFGATYQDSGEHVKMRGNMSRLRATC